MDSLPTICLAWIHTRSFAARMMFSPTGKQKLRSQLRSFSQTENETVVNLIQNLFSFTGFFVELAHLHSKHLKTLYFLGLVVNTIWRCSGEHQTSKKTNLFFKQIKQTTLPNSTHHTDVFLKGWYMLDQKWAKVTSKHPKWAHQIGPSATAM